MSLTAPPATRPARLLALLLAFAGVLFVSITATDTADAAPQNKPSVSAPVTGETADGTPVSGTYTINRFMERNGGLVAKGTFTGTIGDDQNTVTKAVTIPVEGASATPAGDAAADQVVAQQATCEILDLVLGPLDLDLLGLVVHLDTVHLNITAEQGPGNLLGNLLCAVAGLLDGPTTPALNDIIAQLLNYILSLLG